MAIFAKLFCTAVGSVVGAYVFSLVLMRKEDPPFEVALEIVGGLWLGGSFGLWVGREIIKDDSKPN